MAKNECSVGSGRSVALPAGGKIYVHGQFGALGSVWDDVGVASRCHAGEG